MIAVTDEEKRNREFWIAVFLKAREAGLAPANAAEKSDQSLKELKSRDENADYEW